MAGNNLDMFTPQEFNDGKSATAMRTISEVSELLDVPQHVLRFWETKFTQVKPMKRAGGRRFYRPEDVMVLQQVKHLLYAQGYTIKGAKKAFEEQKVGGNDNVKKKAVIVNASAQQPQSVGVSAEEMPAPKIVSKNSAASVRSVDRQTLVSIRDDLKAMRDMLAIRKAIKS